MLSTAFEVAVAEAVSFGFLLGDCGCFDMLAAGGGSQFAGAHGYGFRVSWC